LNIFIVRTPLNIRLERDARRGEKSRMLKRGLSRFAFFLCVLFPGQPVIRAEADAPASAAVWDFDSVSPKSGAENSPAKEVAATLMHEADLWNAHDLNGYLGCYWNSPNCLLVDESDVDEGFQQISENYKNTYTNLDSMGKMNIDRLKVRMIRPDLALAVSVRSVTLSVSDHAALGIDSTILQKFGKDWKIVTAHISNGNL
jgi:hypothetical protein